MYTLSNTIFMLHKELKARFILIYAIYAYIRYIYAITLITGV